MTYRRVLIALAGLALLATSACSTSSSAEKSGETATTEQAQTQESSEKAEESEASEDEEMAEQEEGDDDAEEASADKEKMADNKKMKGGMCPMEVEGTKADIKKMDGAVAMDFTTDGDVGELRKRIQNMADMHNKHHGGMKKGKMKGKKHGKMKMMMAKSSAVTEEIEGGMRMKVTPEKAENLDKLHKHMKQHHEKIAEGKGCPMKMMKGKSADAG